MFHSAYLLRRRIAGQATLLMMEKGREGSWQVHNSDTLDLHLFRRGFQRTVRVFFFSPGCRPHVLFLSFSSDRKIAHRFVPILVLFPCCCSPYQPVNGAQIFDNTTTWKKIGEFLELGFKTVMFFCLQDLGNNFFFLLQLFEGQKTGIFHEAPYFLPRSF